MGAGIVEAGDGDVAAGAGDVDADGAVVAVPPPSPEPQATAVAPKTTVATIAESTRSRELTGTSSRADAI